MHAAAHSLLPGEDGSELAEIDLVFERGGRVEIAIEIKRSTSPALSRGFASAQALLEPKKSYLVTVAWTRGRSQAM